MIASFQSGLRVFAAALDTTSRFLLLFTAFSEKEKRSYRVFCGSSAANALIISSEKWVW